MAISKINTIVNTRLICNLRNGDTQVLQLIEGQNLTTILGGRSFTQKQVASGEFSVNFTDQYVMPQVKLKMSPDVGNKKAFNIIKANNDMTSAVIQVRAVTDEIGAVEGEMILTDATIQNAASLEWDYNAQDGLEIIIQGNKIQEPFLDNLV